MVGAPIGHKKAGGRKKGVPNKATRDIRELAAKHAPEAIKTLVELMKGAENPQTRAFCAEKLLDRAYGKPAQTVIPQNADGSAFDPVSAPLSELARSIAFVLRKGSAEAGKYNG